MTPRTLANLAGLTAKQLIRHRVRTLLTVFGIGAGMFLFAMVESMQLALSSAMKQGADKVTLIVYRENRFCPSTSRLPMYFAEAIRRVPGVREVVPVHITVNHCGASLDTVTFRGVPPDQLLRYAPEIRVIAGSAEDWQRTDDGALIGHSFARRRGLTPGDAFEAAGVRVRVSGVLTSPNVQDNNVAYVHLPFLQQASGAGLGEVTQFNVRVEDRGGFEPVAAAIDRQFATTESPTQTQPEQAFFAQAARELIELASFTRWIGWGAVIAVLGLIGNSVLLAVRTRVREVAVLQALGYPDSALACLVLLEGMWLGCAGGLAGAGGAMVVLMATRLSFGNEGQVLAVEPDPVVFAAGLAAAAVLGGAAAAYPAWISVRRPMVEALRT